MGSEIIKLSVAYYNWAHVDVVIVLQKKHRTTLLLKKKKTKFQLYCVHGLATIWACTIVKLIKFYCYSGFHVANSFYSMLKNSPGVFNPLEVKISNIVKALIIKLENMKEKKIKFSEPGNVHRRPVPWSWPQRLQQQVHDRHWVRSNTFLEWINGKYRYIQSKVIDWFFTTGPLLHPSTPRPRWRTITLTWPSISSNRSHMI